MTAKTAAAALDQPMDRAADLAERAIEGTRRASRALDKVEAEVQEARDEAAFRCRAPLARWRPWRPAPATRPVMPPTGRGSAWRGRGPDPGLHPRRAGKVGADRGGRWSGHGWPDRLAGPLAPPDLTLCRSAPPCSSTPSSAPWPAGRICWPTMPGPTRPWPRPNWGGCAALAPAPAVGGGRGAGAAGPGAGGVALLLGGPADGADARPGCWWPCRPAWAPALGLGVAGARRPDGVRCGALA
jgi:hypothetical protein